MKQRQNETKINTSVHPTGNRNDTNASCGLSRKEARSRYRAIGRNTLFDRDPSSKKPFWRKTLADPAILLFLFFVFLAFFFAPSWVGIVALLALLCVLIYPLLTDRIAGQGESVLDQVRMPWVNVIRDGQQMRIRADRVVPGDLLSLGVGDIVPADCRLVASDRLRVLEQRRDDDEQIVHRAVQKRALPQELVGRSVDFDCAEDLLRGVSEILEGEALAVVLATGDDTRWRIEKYGDAPTEFHRAEWNAGFSERAADPLLSFYSLLQYIALLVLAVIIVVFYAPNEIDLVTVFLSLGAMLCVGARSILLSYLRSAEARWRDARLHDVDTDARAVIKSNQSVDRLMSMTDLFVMGSEAVAILCAEDASKKSFSSLSVACQEKGIRLSIFLDELPTDPDVLRKIDPSMMLIRQYVVDEKAVDLTEYIGKYRVFCGFERASIRALLLSLRRQRHRVSVMSERADTLDMMAIGSLAIGIAEFSGLIEKQTERQKMRETKPTPSALVRHADLLLAPRQDGQSAVSTLLSLVQDADLIAARGMATLRYLLLSQVLSFSLVLFSCLLGVGAPYFFHLLIGTGCSQAFAVLWITSLRTSISTRKPTLIGSSRITRSLTEKTLWLPVLATVLFCVAYVLVIKALGVIPTNAVAPFLFASLLLLQACMLPSVRREGLAVSALGLLLPIAAVLLPSLIMTAFCFAFSELDLLLQLASWNAVTLCSLPLVPLSYLLFRRLFLRFFYRTAK